ncbi:M66 family metalloprotease [Candidatus Palauibacter sp.]|uniref:M66 family metalloprotease n=1 Tax=Candidatus Palauibacter sp. TaxID=3101350 RepID=UPI003B51731D
MAGKDPSPVGPGLLALVLALGLACGDEPTAPPPATPNQRPVPTNTIPAQELAAGDTLTVEASAYFTDPDGDALTFSAETSDRSVVTASLSGTSVAVAGVAPGEARVTIRARDPSGRQAVLTFEVLVPLPVTADHVALEALYRATGGDGWHNDENWLTGRALDTWHGVEVDGDGRVAALDLEFNRLEGALPPELGDLSGLWSLNLSRNALSGGIPPELSRLSRLGFLSLNGNDLTGPIPSHIGDLTTLGSLDLSDNEFTGPIPPELGTLRGLSTLDLSDNELDGPIPPELGDLTRLQRLLLLRNSLVGPIPEEFRRLAQLQWLNLSGNAGLSGSLPLSLMSIPGLFELHLGGTALCAPADRAFAEWLERLRRHRVSPCGNDGAVLLTQAVQSAAFPVPLIAGDSALLRVFLTAPAGSIVDLPRVRARFYVDDSEVHVADIAAQSNPVPVEIDEGSLESSANAVIPGRVVQPGLEVVVETDPDATLDPALGLTRRIPEIGRLAVDVRLMPTFDVTVVPFLLNSDPDRSIVDIVQSLTPEHELLWDTRTLLPIGDFTITRHEPVMTSSRSQSTLIGETAAIRRMEGGTRHYMGTMVNSDGGGLGQRPGFVTFSDPRADIIAHEFGHNMSLSHAPCSATSVDPWYPVPGGFIGAWGYDSRDGGSLVSPEMADIMGYCDPHWIGDYHFNNAMRHRLRTERDESSSGDAAPGRHSTLLLWGGVDDRGTPYLEPAFVLDAPPGLPRSGGEYRIHGKTATGRELFELRFDMPLIRDGNGASSFAFALPVQSGWDEALASLSLSGPGGSVTLDGASDRRVALVRDPVTRRVRALLRDLPSTPLAGAVADALSLEPGLEVQISRGIPDPSAWDR